MASLYFDKAHPVFYNVHMAPPNRANTHYKDTVFRLLFSDKQRLLSLYNAMSDKACDNADDLTVVTLADAIYMEVKNDIAFLVGTDIHLWEHQSTINPNMPLRFLEYIAVEYQRLTDKRSIYSSRLVKLPRPHFVVFYNGTQSCLDHDVLRLSDAFAEAKSAALELTVDVYNINAGHSPELLDACDALKGYGELVKRTRENQRTMPFAQAINKAVDECIHEGILADFLNSCKAEVIGVSIFEFDRAEYERQEKEDVAHDKALSVAKNMARMGFSTEQIAEATELPPCEVAAL